MAKFALRLEARPTPSRLMAWLSPVLAVLLTVLCGALLFLALGHDPLAGLAVFFVEPLRDAHGWSELGIKVAPLLLIAVGLATYFGAAHLLGALDLRDLRNLRRRKGKAAAVVA